jgi:6-phosphofructokinase 1
MNQRQIARVHQLGVRTFATPLLRDTQESLVEHRFVSDDVALPLHIVEGESFAGQKYFEMAGPREQVYFDPSRTRAAIVTCGGLCPGLNNVIRSIYLELHYHYGTSDVLGIRYGYHGLNPENPTPPVQLDLGMISDIHESGGSILGTSRGPESPEVMVNFLRDQNVSILFAIGGDGTQRGAWAIHEEAIRQRYELAVVGIPKTIDNDIHFVSRTFGFITAVEEARGVIDSAHTEARAVLNGVGLVKLMGRDSGFIAASATVASGEVNYCFIPEIAFHVDGPNGLLPALQQRLERKQHCVIVLAEGAGQDLIPRKDVKLDASGNVIHADIGLFLRDRIRAHFDAIGRPVNVRYIDPSYIIRSKKANTEDSILCDRLARNAVHAAMAGKSGLIIGFMHEKFVHVPAPLATRSRKRVQEHGMLWGAVLASTGQPLSFLNP